MMTWTKLLFAWEWARITDKDFIEQAAKFGREARAREIIQRDFYLEAE